VLWNEIIRHGENKTCLFLFSQTVKTTGLSDIFTSHSRVVEMKISDSMHTMYLEDGWIHATIIQTTR
jgi:hypothetical protein